MALRRALLQIVTEPYDAVVGLQAIVGILALPVSAIAFQASFLLEDADNFIVN